MNYGLGLDETLIYGNKPDIKEILTLKANDINNKIKKITSEGYEQENFINLDNKDDENIDFLARQRDKIENALDAWNTMEEESDNSLDSDLDTLSIENRTKIIAILAEHVTNSDELNYFISDDDASDYNLSEEDEDEEDKSNFSYDFTDDQD